MIRMVKNPRNGIFAIKMSAPAKVLSRHCLAGDIIAVEEQIGTQRTIMPAQDGLSSEHAEYLIKLKLAVAYNPRPGDKIISVAPVMPEPKIESAMDPAPARSERAVMPRQKAGGAI